VNSQKNHAGWRPCLSGLVVVLTVLSARAGDSWQTNYVAFGKLLVTNFVAAPFPDPARANGHTYHGKFYSAKEHYSDSTVAMFIPKNFHATDHMDFVVHFHGWNHTVAEALPEYKLIEQFADSGKNAILIVPQGPYNAPDSFGGKLEDTNGFARFMEEAMDKLHTDGVLTNGSDPIGDIILSGHSGGYRVMSEIVDHGGLSDKIREVWLFDALYAGTDNFVSWQKQENGRLLDIFTDHGGTEEETRNLMASLKKQNVSFFFAEDTNAVPDNLQTNKLVFLHTDMIHNDVVAKRGTFEQFLKTSCLENQ
jgi:hypothetical protein